MVKVGRALYYVIMALLEKHNEINFIIISFKDILLDIACVSRDLDFLSFSTPWNLEAMTFKMISL